MRVVARQDERRVLEGVAPLELHARLEELHHLGLVAGLQSAHPGAHPLPRSLVIGLPVV